ncbi:MAG: hypothetical protein ACLP6E_06220 [Acidimicrobiales bacterium]
MQSTPGRWEFDGRTRLPGSVQGGAQGAPPSGDPSAGPGGIRRLLTAEFRRSAAIGSDRERFFLAYEKGQPG